MNSITTAIRRLRNSPGFTAVAVLTLGLCIGANLTIFAIVDAILIRALPFPEPDRLVAVNNVYPGAGVDRGGASIANYFERRGAIDAFESVSLITEYPFTVGEDGATRNVMTARVTSEFFETLGVPLAMGQLPTEASLDYSAREGVIITDRFWRRYFNGDPKVLGRTFKMHTIERTVRGVLPPDFRYLSSKAEIYGHLSHYRSKREPDNRHANDAQMIARLASGATLAEAQSQLEALNTQLLTDDPIAATVRDSGFHTTVMPLHEDHVRSVKPSLLLVQAGVACLLLIGVVNLAGLLLIRASGRVKAIAVQKALGASAWRLAANVTTETTLLSLLGSGLGIVFSMLGIQLTKFLGTGLLPLGAQIAFDGRSGMLAVLISVVLGITIALPILWYHLKEDASTHLQSEARGGSAGQGMQQVRHAFIVTQIAAAFVLLFGAGLLAVSLKKLLDESPGFEPDQVLTAPLVLPYENYPDGRSRVAFVNTLLERLGGLPGVVHAAVSSGLPFTIDGSVSKTIFPEAVDGGGTNQRAHYFSAVSPGYWQAMKIPLLQGRVFRETDMVNAHRVAVIDEHLAELHWPNGDAIGNRFSTTAYSEIDKKIFGPVGSTFVEESAYTVVGIVGNVRQTDLAEPQHLGAIYIPFTETLKMQIVLRSQVTPHSLNPMVTQIVKDLDADLPVDHFQTMRDRIDDSLVMRRSPAILAGVFAGMALLLAAMGIYGTLAYAVSQRRREIGVRMALGALRRQVGGQFLRMSFKLLGIGALLGLFGAWMLGRIMQGILVEVPPLHLATVAGTIAILCVAVLVAALVPAWRASRLEPMEALRSD